jgi:aerobic-type carbon monoxide dehydrogenase small subunit (CoxS/CutS family)
MPAIELHVNGEMRRVEADPSHSLLSVLRNAIGLTGTKYGCGEGQCGACTVLVDGRAVRSCITPAGDIGARPVVTIEGLSRDGRLHAVQQAFIDETAMQCGYCTAGMIISAVGLLNRDAAPGEEEIRRALEGNICRCGTYPRIVAAVRRAARAGAENHDE